MWVFAVPLLPGAGMCARRRTYFLLLRQKKVGKEKANPGVCVPLRPCGAKGAARGARSRGGAVELAARWRAPLGHPRRVRSRSRRVLRHACPPRALRSSAQTQGWGAAHGPLLRSALGARVLRTAHPELGGGRGWLWPSAAMACLTGGRATRRPESLPSGCAWGAQGAGWRACRRTRPLRELICRGCLNGAHAVRAVSSTAHPAPEHPRLPRSPRGRTGSQTAGSPFFWVLFFGEAKKSTSPAGASPGKPSDCKTV